MIGRLLGGIATSLLFSVFEAWLIGAHASAGVMVSDCLDASLYLCSALLFDLLVCSIGSLTSLTNSRTLKQSHLGKSFSSAQYGNSIVAILAGQIANKAANFAEFKPTSEESGFYLGGYLGPFDVSLVALVQSRHRPIQQNDVICRSARLLVNRSLGATEKTGKAAKPLPQAHAVPM